MLGQTTYYKVSPGNLTSTGCAIPGEQVPMQEKDMAPGKGRDQWAKHQPMTPKEREVGATRRGMGEVKNDGP